jgi:nucleoside-diphosphate-sugar epimerase
MSRTLVTGANSFVASHIIDTLISQGHSVTGTLRRINVGDEILKEHPEWNGNLRFVEIGDLSNQSLWEDLFKKQTFDYIVHVAAPIVGKAGLTDYDQDWLTPSVEG